MSAQDCTPVKAPLSAPGTLRWLLLTLMLALSATAQALTPTDLQTQGRLEIGAELLPDEDIVAGQKLSLVITIATDRWFVGGTRIRIPEVPGLVILQTEQFANNASENRGGQSWVLQRWTLDVYPQREGDFNIPPIEVQLRVSDEQAGEVAGPLETPVVAFTAIRPEALATADHWVASPGFRVSQRFDRSLEGLKTGDAFDREIIFEAQDLMAMMLPAIEAETLDGLAVYPLPPKLENSSNRGVSTARRVERISYVVEKPGEWLLPARDFFWWDTTTREVRLLSLEETLISVTGTGVAEEEAPGDLIQNPRRLAVIVGVLLALGLLLLALRRLPPLPVAGIRRLLDELAGRWRALRAPALASRLNPDGSAGD